MNFVRKSFILKSLTEMIRLFILLSLFWAFQIIEANTIQPFYNSTGPQNGSSFGQNLLICSNMIMIGAPNYQNNTGMVSFYNLFSGELIISYIGENLGDGYGTTLAQTSGYCIIGAPNYMSRTGKVYLYNSFNLNSFINFTGEENSSYFGSEIISNSNQIIIAAPEFQTDTGKVYLYNLSTGNLSYSFTGESPLDNFGSALDADDNLLVIGANTYETNTGRVYLYNLITANFTLSITGEISDFFGSSVLITDEYLIIGKPGVDKVAVYNRTFVTFVTDLNGISVGSKFGTKLIFSNDYLIITAPEESAVTGAFYVYNMTTLTPLYTHAGEQVGDRFGHSIAINFDYVLVGAYGNSQFRGKIYLYFLSNGTLINTTQGENNDDYYGISLEMSYGSGGPYFICGAPGFSFNQGKVYVYTLNMTVQSTSTDTTTAISSTSTGDSETSSSSDSSDLGLIVGSSVGGVFGLIFLLCGGGLFVAICLCLLICLVIFIIVVIVILLVILLVCAVVIIVILVGSFGTVATALFRRKKNQPDEILQSDLEESSEKLEEILSTPYQGQFRELDYTDLEFDKQIGAGAYGKVYKGKWRGVIVAIKVLNMEDISGNKQAIEELRREAAIMQKLGNHPNIVKFVGAVTTEQHFCLVTEFCRNGSLEDYVIKKKTPLSDQQLIRMIRDAAAGVVHLHKEGVIHRDIAARNFLLGTNMEVQVADFGTSRIFTVEQEGAANTKSTIGPVRWMAPEALSEREYSPATDAYSFGMFIYELTAKEIPFAKIPDLVNVIQAVLVKGQRPLIPGHVDPKLTEIMQACWITNPKERISVKEIWKTLNQYLGEDSDNQDETNNQSNSSCSDPGHYSPLTSPETSANYSAFTHIEKD